MTDKINHNLGNSSIYQIFIRNFTQEGTFSAAIDKLSGVVKMGFDIIYLTPVHPVGQVARKGSLGSPYAIADYMAVDSSLGGMEGFRNFLDAAHSLGLRVIMDIVFNHVSPDSVIAVQHPEWIYKDQDGLPGRKVPEWSDIVDLDFSSKNLMEYLFKVLEFWRSFGADGFRCDVASIIPLDFWIEARKRVDAVNTNLDKSIWLAESIRKEHLLQMRREGFKVHSDPELYRVFDITYDYDGRAELENSWNGLASINDYLKYLRIQEMLFPQDFIKARFLENHDLGRAAYRFPGKKRLMDWTAFTMLLPGTFFAYMGQEYAFDHKPDLFEKDSLIQPDAANLEFQNWFSVFHKAARKIKSETIYTDVLEISNGLISIRKFGGGKEYRALIDFSENQSARLPECTISGKNMIDGNNITLHGGQCAPVSPMLIEL